jgi:hypothetical protein
MEDRKLVCKSDYEAAKSKGQLSDNLGSQELIHYLIVPLCLFVSIFYTKPNQIPNA